AGGGHRDTDRRAARRARSGRAGRGASHRAHADRREHPPVLKPTRLLDLALNVVLAAAVAWIGTRVAYPAFPPLSVAAGASLLPVAALEAWPGFGTAGTGPG